MLFVSEKRSALDVVYERFKAQDLNYLVAYFNSEKNQKKEFYANLKHAIDKPLNYTELDNSIDNQIKELENYFRSYSTVLSQTNDNLDCSIFDLVSYLAENQVNDLEYNIQVKIPAYKQWFRYVEFLEDIEEIASSIFNVKSIAELSFIDLNKSSFL